MKKLKKLVLTLGIISIIFILLAFSASAADSSSTVIEGSADNITYKIYTDAQVMIVSGEGKIPDHMFCFSQEPCYICHPEMMDFEDWGVDEPPTDFEKTVSNIKTIIIDDGITEIGHKAFQMFGYETSDHNLKTVILPESLKKIGELAFFYQKGLENINLPSNLEEIGESAF